MDYYEIGQRIRKIRKAKGMSQEQLAEKVGISVTHMSHIETGNTKLSLEVFASISQSLCAGADELLFGQTKTTGMLAFNHITELLTHCSPRELCIISDIAAATKNALARYGEDECDRSAKT